MKPSKAKERYQKELGQKAERSIEQVIYTANLIKSLSKSMQKLSWCATKNLKGKLRTVLNKFANDAEIVSRFPIQTREKSRAVAIDINKRAGLFIKEGKKESYAWSLKASYLSSFKDYGPDAKKLN